METITTINQLKKVLNLAKANEEKIGFVPTMGFLHAGHGALLSKARLENDKVVLSVFVNPTQFNDPKDFATYPRDLKRDQSFAKQHKVDYFFQPDAREIYPEQTPMFTIDVCKATEILCGRTRPGHFNGVALVIVKLLNIVAPHNLYLGQKDVQQVVVINNLLKELFIDISLKIVDTYREHDNLALSSRNVLLTKSERFDAVILYQTLMQVKNFLGKGLPASEAILRGEKYFHGNTKLATLDYLEVYEFPTLKAVQARSEKILIAIAVFYSKARLIDNLIIEQKN